MRGGRKDSYIARWHRFFGRPHHPELSNQDASRTPFSRLVGALTESHARSVRTISSRHKWGLQLPTAALFAFNTMPCVAFTPNRGSGLLPEVIPPPRAHR